MVKKGKKESEVDLELRPHHIHGYLGHELQPEVYEMSDEEYLVFFRKARGEDPADQHKEGQHTDKLILLWRATIKRLHDNPDTKFKYVIGLDSVCKKCKNKGICNDKQHWAYKIVKKADDDFAKYTPELEPGKVYDGRYCIKLFRKKGWLKK